MKSEPIETNANLRKQLAIYMFCHIDQYTNRSITLRQRKVDVLNFQNIVANIVLFTSYIF